MAGTIQKKGPKTWLVRIFNGRDASGKTKHFNKTIHGSKKDAQKYLTKKLNEKNEGVFIEPAKMSLNDHLEKWMKNVAKIKVREATYNGYEAKIKRHIKEGIGKTRLCDLQAYDVQSLYNRMIEHGLSAKTVRHVHNILSPALKCAIKWRLINHNPCDLCELPKLEHKEMLCFTPDEVDLFLANAKEDRYFAAFSLALETGMRPEEYLGLMWKDIDLEKGVLSVRRALILRKGGGFYFEEPKTKTSRRSIPLSSKILALLKAHKREQTERAFKLGSAYEKLDLVFPTELGTPTLYGNLDRRHLKKIIKTINELVKKENEESGSDKPFIKTIRLYDLRHTMATMLLLAGINPKVVSERLGHASVSLTLDTYSHVLPSMQKEATNTMETLMYGT